jgi:hypothetical protein
MSHPNDDVPGKLRVLIVEDSEDDTTLLLKRFRSRAPQ